MGSNTELESYLHSTMTAIDCNSMDGDSDSDGDFYLPSPQDLACQAGGPPATYIAQKWAEILVPQGEALFGRQDIANCVLIVGQSRYFVHWQVLWVKKKRKNRAAMGFFLSLKLFSPQLIFVLLSWTEARTTESRHKRKKNTESIDPLFRSNLSPSFFPPLSRPVFVVSQIRHPPYLSLALSSMAPVSSLIPAEMGDRGRAPSVI